MTALSAYSVIRNRHNFTTKPTRQSSERGRVILDRQDRFDTRWQGLHCIQQARQRAAKPVHKLNVQNPHAFDVLDGSIKTPSLTLVRAIDSSRPRDRDP